MNNDREARWLDAWYAGRRWVYWLLPLEGLFRLLSGARRFIQTRYFQKKMPVPVIVVGNLSVGGTGKTPVIIALVNALAKQGYKVGVVSRGYGSEAPEYPYIVNAASSVVQAGDEPLAIWRATGAAVCIDADRVAAARTLIQSGCTVLLSDDGLQHYRLGRTIEIAVLDSARGMGNGHCLPVGPLREPVSRLREVDFIIANQTQVNTESYLVDGAFRMRLQPKHWFSVKNLKTFPLETIANGRQVHAVAGIGHPQRFFNTLTQLGLAPQPHIYPDHHVFTAANFTFKTPLPVVMTSKDAVKCQAFAKDEWLALEVEAVIDKPFWQALERKLQSDLTGLSSEPA